MAHPAFPRDDLSASSRLLPIHTSSNQPIRELIEWDWHYPIKTHYSTRLVENPKFALNTAPHQTQLFRQKWTYRNPKRVISFQISLSNWPNYSRPIRNQSWKLLNSCSSLSFTVQSLSIPTGAIRLIHIESFYESYLLLRIWYIYESYPKTYFFKYYSKTKKNKNIYGI